jgi:hypothetical protein
MLAILIQLARSQFVLQFNHNEQWLAERDRLLNQAPADVQVNPSAVACLAYAGSQTVSLEIRDNAVQTLAYMKQAVQLVDVEREPLPFEKCAQLLIATGNLDAIANIDGLDEYVHLGGSAFFMHWLDSDRAFNQLYRKLGILAFEFAGLTNGIHLTSNVLLGEKGLKTGQDFIYNTSLSVEIDNESMVLAESLDGMPLLWKRSYGEGSFTIFNGDTLGIKSNRGMIAGAVSLMQPDYIYPILNSKVFYIDDFPAPVTRELIVDIYRKYKLDLAGFYREIWWPDMLKASKKYNVKYTAAIIETFNAQITPPFRDPVDAEYHSLIAYGREVLKSGGEISLHGYNHQSLQSDQAIADFFKYKSWKSQADMELSIEEALRFIATAFPNYSVMSYVPPSNVLGPDGRAALKKAWPDLAVISSLYDTDYEGRSYVQEYGVAEDGIIELPRITSGYLEDPYSRWVEANAMTSIGVFSHFLHPDDLLDKKRSNNQQWEQLYEDFTDLLDRLQLTYPWLRDMTSTEAGLVVANQMPAQITWEKTSNRIDGQIAPFSNEIHFILRTERTIGRQVNCSIQKIDHQTYLVKAHKARFAVELGG